MLRPRPTTAARADAQVAVEDLDANPRLLEVIRLGHPILRHVAEPVPEDWFSSARLVNLGRDIIRTMIEDEPEIPPTVLANPEIRPIGEDSEEGWEGCLSIPGLRGLVPRNRRIKVKARRLDGEPVSLTADGFHARVIQHEYDHLDGVVFLDRMTDIRSLVFEPEWERYILGAESDDH